MSKKSVSKSTHPWRNDWCRALVKEAQAAQGTYDHKEKLKQCSEGILQEYNAYVKRTKKN